MIKVYKDWVIAADENQYKLGTVVKITDKATGETKDSLKVDHYTGSIEQALKIILRVEKRRIAHFIHEKCGYRESFSSHALACGIISIKEIKR